MRGRSDREIDAALEAAKIKPCLMPRTGRQGIVKALALEQLVARNPSHQAKIAGQALLSLDSLLRGGIFVAEKAAAVQGQAEALRSSELEEVGVGVGGPRGSGLGLGSRRPQRDDHHAPDNATQTTPSFCGRVTPPLNPSP